MVKGGMLASNSPSQGSMKTLLAHGDSSHPQKSHPAWDGNLVRLRNCYPEVFFFWFAAEKNLKIIGSIKKKINCNQLWKTAKESEDGKQQMYLL